MRMLCFSLVGLSIWTSVAATQIAPQFKCFPTSPGTVDRSHVTIKLAKRGWLSHQLAATVAEIILHEFLGYSIELDQKPSGTGWGQDIKEGTLDADMENWYAGKPSDPSYVEFITGTQEAFDMGPIGFTGRVGFYTFRSALLKNQFADYYSFYKNESAAKQAGFPTFADSRLHELIPSDERCSGFSWCGTDGFDGYYAPPACQDDPGSCLEILSAWVSYTSGYWESRFHNLGIRGIWGYYAGKLPEYLESFKGSQRVPLFNWWEPDPLLVQLDAVHISLPDYYIGCDRDGARVRADPVSSSMACDGDQVQIRKLASRRVRENAAEAFFFLQRYELSKDRLNAMIGAAVNQGSDEAAVNAVACDYIVQNAHTFRSYAPTCITNPPHPVKDGDEVFNAETLECEIATIFHTTSPTDCFGGQRPPSATADRSDRTIKLVRRPWMSHDLISTVAEVLLRDYLGFAVELVYNNRTGQSAFGPEMVEEHYHVDMENWHVGPNSEGHVQFIAPQLLQNIGETGYHGRSGIFIQRNALDVDPLLGYYKRYVNASGLMPLGVASHDESPLREVLQAVGAEFPVCAPLEYTWCGSGAMQGFWSPPKCSDIPDDCIELVHGPPSWDTGYTEQLVKNHDLGAVVAYYGVEGLKTVILQQAAAGKFSPFYWFEPDEFLAVADAERISFPDYTYGCDSGNTGNPETGTTACDFPAKQLSKVAIPAISQHMQEAYYVLQRIEIFQDQLNILIADDGEPSLSQRVCNFLLSNQEMVDEWAPSCLVDPLPFDRVGINDTIFRPEELRCEPVRCGKAEVLVYAAQFRSFYCRACGAGEVPDAQQKTCVSCPAGEEVDGDAGRCRKCAPGSSKPVEGTACEPCAKGRFVSEAGASECLLCNTSSFQNETGARDCQLCGQILEGGVTPLLGATAGSDCLCPRGTFRPLDARSCQSCLDGMMCEAGADARNLPSYYGQEHAGTSGPFPATAEGYMTIPSDPLKVYQCLNKAHCPGGPPGACASNRDPQAVACGVCLQDYFPTDSGCEKCTGSEAAGVVIAILLGVLGCAVAAFVLHRNILLKSSGMLAIVLISGQIITTMQTLTVFQQLDIDWKEPLMSILSVLKVVSFDLKLLRASCVFGNSEMRSYMLRQLVAPVSVPLLAIFLSIKKRFKPSMTFVNEFINTVGTIFNMFLISILVSAVSPMVCYPHPAGSGRSMVSSSSTLCDFEDVHGSFVGVGIAACLLVPLPFFALTAYGILRYKHYVRRSVNGLWFLNAFRFLFMRFHPSGYWFSIVIIARSILCCLIPVVLSTPGMQVLCLAMVICAYDYIQLNIQPWRNKVSNLSDAALSKIVLMILICLAVLSDFEAQGAVKVTAVIGFCMCLFAPMGMLLWVFRNMVIKDKYEAFICHHKADATAQARLLKMLLVAKTGRQIFVDSDDLIELDKLFDTVKSKVKLLLVYLTRDTLTRPWCVGEITTAFNSGGRVRVQTVRTPSFSQPTAEQIGQMFDQVDHSSCNLQEQGLHVAIISAALARVVGPDTPTLVMNSDLVGSEKFMDIADRVVSSRREGKSISSPPSSPTTSNSRSKLDRSRSMKPQAGQVVACADKSDDEAVAATSILMTKISPQLCAFVDAGVVNLADRDGELNDDLAQIEASRACVFVLSRRSLDVPEQVVAMAVGMSTPSATMIPLNLWDFKFPTAAFYNELPNMWPPKSSISAEVAQVRVKAFFNLISVFFATMASDSVLDTQAEQVVSRVSRNYVVKNGSTTHGPSGTYGSSGGTIFSSKRTSPQEEDVAQPTSAVVDEGLQGEEEDVNFELDI